MPSFFKELWCERYDEAYTEAIDAGLSRAEADRRATRHAEGTAELLGDTADRLRSERKDNGHGY